ncbi:MAG: glutathione transferase GstA [Legionella sp.]|nr:MAG: glutathione transferase GstA [Legionella sp.]
MKLYYYPGSCSLVVRIILNELNIKFEEDLVDLRAKKTASGEDYQAINPKGSVPAIALDNGQVITENQVILQYLADTSPVQTLLPPVKDIKRYQTLEWLNYISTELHKSIGMFFNPNCTEEMKTKMLTPMIMVRFKMLNERLSKGAYLMGDNFSLPDAYLFVMVRWAHYFKMNLSEFSALNKYIEKLHERASVKKSLEQEAQ